MNAFKKVLAVMLSVIMLASLAACSGTGSGSSTGTPSPTATPAATSTPTPSSTQEPEPVVQGPYFNPAVPLTWLIRGNDTDYQADNRGQRGFVEIQDKIGVVLEIQTIEGNSDDQLKLMLASGTFPDIIKWTLDAAYPGGIPKMVSDGIALVLNDLVDDYMPNFKALMEERSDIRREITDPDYQYFYLPYIYPMLSENDKAIVSTTGFAMRTDWLENVGMDAPDNIAEWYDVLTAFKNGDPNGNGVADEVPFEGTGLDMFAPAWGIRRGYFVKPGTQTVAYGPLEPEYRDYLAEMNKWYKEGLVTMNSVKTDSKVTDANIIADVAGSWKALTNNWEKYLDDLRKVNPNANFDPIDWPTTKDGQRYTDRTELVNHVDKEKTIITTSCKNPEAAARLIDYMYTEEGGTLLAWGIEGKSYEVVNGENKLIEFEKDANPGRAYYVKPHVTWPKYGFSDAWAQTFNPIRIVAAKAWAANVSSDLIYPPFLVFNQEETNKIADINADVGTYINDMTNAFITGDEPLTNFDTFVANVKKYGLEEVVKIYQTNLDAYNKK